MKVNAKLAMELVNIIFKSLLLVVNTETLCETSKTH